MNINSLKKCLWLSLVLTIAGTIGLAAYNYRTENRKREERYYKHLPLLDPKLRVELGEELSQALCANLPGSYNMAILERKAHLYRQAMERNANLDRQVIPAELVERTKALRSPQAIDDGLLQLHQTLIQLGRLNMGYLEAQRQMALYGPFDYTSDSMARYLAGEIDWKQIWLWGVYLCIIASLLSALVNCIRASELRITPLLLFFLPEFFLINAGGIGFVPGFINRYKPEEVKRRAWRNAMGFFSALFSFLGVGGKTFAQERENREEAMKAPMALVVATPARNNTWETTCSASTGNQLHPDLDAAIFYAAPVATVSCTQQNGRALLGLLYWRGLSAVPGSSRHEVGLSAGLKLRHGPVQSTFTLVYVNPEPIGQVGKGDALLLTLRQEVVEQKVRGLKLSPFVTTTYATPIKGNSPGRGWILGTGSGYNFQLNSAWSVGGQVKIIRDFGAFGFPKAFLGYASTGLIRDLGSGVTLTLPSVVASTPFTAGSNRGTYVTVGASISKSWK